MRYLIRSHGTSLALAFAATLVSASAPAFVETPVLIPANPRAGEAIEFTVRSGGCHALLINDPPNDDRRELVRSGNVVRVTVEAIYVSSPFCVNPTNVRRISIGSLPPGDYILELYGRLEYETPGGPLLFTSANFQVIGADPVAIPASDWPVLSLLLALVAGVGAARVSSQRVRLPAVPARVTGAEVVRVRLQGRRVLTSDVTSGSMENMNRRTRRSWSA